MLRKEKNGVHWLEFELLADLPYLRHGVFLRHGGHSQGTYSSLNLSYHVGDDPRHVEANLCEVANIMGLPKLVWGEQHHGKTIALATPDWTSSTRCDGLATVTPHLGLLIHHADCQAAIMVDPVHRAVANVHSGWRGSAQNIYAEALAFMKHHFHTKADDVLVCISPSLGPENAEFIHYRQELPESFWEFQIKPNYFDFWAISAMQLRQCGVLEHHIQVAGISTYAHPEDYYSYRYSKIRGGHGTLVSLIH